MTFRFLPPAEAELLEGIFHYAGVVAVMAASCDDSELLLATDVRACCTIAEAAATVAAISDRMIVSAPGDAVDTLLCRAETIPSCDSHAAIKGGIVGRATELADLRLQLRLSRK